MEKWISSCGLGEVAALSVVDGVASGYQLKLLGEVFGEALGQVSCTAAAFEEYAGWNSQSFISQGRLFFAEPPLPTILPTAESTQSVYSQLHVSFHNMTRDSIAGWLSIVYGKTEERAGLLHGLHSVCT